MINDWKPTLHINCRSKMLQRICYKIFECHILCQLFSMCVLKSVLPNSWTSFWSVEKGVIWWLSLMKQKIVLSTKSVSSTRNCLSGCCYCCLLFCWIVSTILIFCSKLSCSMNLIELEWSDRANVYQFCCSNTVVINDNYDHRLWILGKPIII